MRHSGNRLRILLIVAAVSTLTACGASRAYRQGQNEAKKGNWDMAVARLTKALDKDPENIGYKIALQNARVKASQFHRDEARKHLAAEDLEKAADELEIASKYDPGNRTISDELSIVRARIAGRDEQTARMREFAAMKERVQARKFPIPILSPRSSAPINMNFPEQGLEKIFDALAKVSGVNILFDPDFRDKKVTVRLSGVSFQEALDQITMAHRLFYKVIDRNTIIIVPEGAAKRRIYDDIFLRTFYIENAELKEVETVVKTALGAQAKVVSNPTLNALNVIGTVDEIALAERVISGNDKSKGEVMVDVQILEVNRNRMRQLGLGLANYSGSVSLQPFADTEGNTLDVRAHLLSSLNLSDFVVSIPNRLLVNFLQTDTNTRILASPRLRAAEGKKTTLKVGTEVPVPVTTFTSAQPNVGGTFAPATSFQYRNVGVNLELTPKVNANGDILLELAAEFSILGGDQEVAGTRLPTFLTRNVTGVLRLRDGETSLIGGLLSQQEGETTSGIPGMTSIPLIGKLLSNPTKRQESAEVVISITPHLVRGPKVIEADLEPLRLGTKETFRVEGARDPLFGEEVPEPSASPTPPPGLTSPGPEIGRPPGTVSPSLPLPGEQITPAATPPPPQVFPTPLPPSVPETVPTPPPPVVLPTPVPSPEATPAPELGPQPTPTPNPFQVPPPLAQGADPDGGRGAVPAAAAQATSRPVQRGRVANPDAPLGPPGAVRLGPGGPGAEPGPTGPVSASLSPARAAAKVGETVSLSLVLMNLQGLEGLEVVLAFDPALLEAAEAKAGTLLTIDGAAVGIERSAEVGRMRLKLTRPSGVAGSGVVAGFAFKAVAAGPAEVRVESITLTTTAGTARPPVPPAARVTVAR
jgi:general secretion pathway protein D